MMSEHIMDQSMTIYLNVVNSTNTSSVLNFTDDKGSSSITKEGAPAFASVTTSYTASPLRATTDGASCGRAATAARWTTAARALRGTTSALPTG